MAPLFGTLSNLFAESTQLLFCFLGIKQEALNTMFQGALWSFLPVTAVIPCDVKAQESHPTSIASIALIKEKCGCVFYTIF